MWKPALAQVQALGDCLGEGKILQAPLVAVNSFLMNFIDLVVVVVTEHPRQQKIINKQVDDELE